MAGESEQTDDTPSRGNRRPGRRRRNKKDVILDLSKRRKSRKQTEPEVQPPSLKVKKRKFETQGQYMRRIDRLVAIAKVEAIMETKISGLRDERNGALGVEMAANDGGGNGSSSATRKGPLKQTPRLTPKTRPARIGAKAKTKRK